jgi:hypothetical protein
MKLDTNNKICIHLNTGYDNKTTEDTGAANFLGLRTGNNLKWIRNT